MTFPYTSLAFLVLLGGCIVDTKLGDDEGEPGTGGSSGGVDGPGATSAGPGGNPSTSGETSAGGSSSDDGLMTTDGGVVDECDWEPDPALACEPGESSIASVAGDPLPELQGEACTIDSTTLLPPTFTLVLSCASDDYVIQIEAAEFQWPFEADDPVLVDAGLGLSELDGQPSFAIRDSNGALLLGWLNSELQDEDAFEALLAPISFDVLASGCEGVEDIECGGVRQPARLAFDDGGRPTTVSSGQTGMLADPGPFAVAVPLAQWYPCWDSCGGDWSPGRFNVLVWAVDS